MKRILYIHNTYPDSENANLLQVIHMCNAMHKNGHDVTLALPRNIFKWNRVNCRTELKNNLGIEINFNIIEFKKISLLNKLHFMGGLFGINSIFKNEKYDICIIRHAAFVRFALIHKIPTIFEAHHIQVHDTSKLQNMLWTKELINCSKNKSFKIFLCISEELKKSWAKKGVAKDKLRVLHDGFCEELFGKMIDTNDAKRYLNLPLQKKIIVYVGSLYKDRGINQILSLASIFKREIFVLVGGPDKEKLKLIEQTKKMRLKNVIFKGRVKNTEVPMYLYSADILLMIWTKNVKTIEYCSPLKLFEYMASGKTIVGYGFKTIKEVLTNGKDSLLAKPDDVEELEKHLKAAINHEETIKFGSIARREAFNRYTWSIRAKKLVSYFN